MPITAMPLRRRLEAAEKNRYETLFWQVPEDPGLLLLFQDLC